MSLFGKKEPENPNKDLIDSSKCNFLLTNGACGMMTYGQLKRCAKENCVIMQMLQEKRKNRDYIPEPEIRPPESLVAEEDKIEEKELPEDMKKLKERVEKKPSKNTITYNPDGTVAEE